MDGYKLIINPLIQKPDLGGTVASRLIDISLILGKALYL